MIDGQTVAVGALRACVDQKIGDKKYRKKTENPRFAFHYGQQSVEVFNAFSQFELKQIEYLRVCLIELDNSLFWDR